MHAKALALLGGVAPDGDDGILLGVGKPLFGHETLDVVGEHQRFDADVIGGLDGGDIVLEIAGGGARAGVGSHLERAAWAEISLDEPVAVQRDLVVENRNPFFAHNLAHRVVVPCGIKLEDAEAALAPLEDVVPRGVHVRCDFGVDPLCVVHDVFRVARADERGAEGGMKCAGSIRRPAVESKNAVVQRRGSVLEQHL